MGCFNPLTQDVGTKGFLRMRTICHLRRQLIGIIIFWVALMLSVQAQDGASGATFLAYDCVYDPSTDNVQIQAVLMGSDGDPIPPSDYTIQVDIPNNSQNVFTGAVAVTPLQARLPLQIVIVLDITETVPLPRMLVQLQQFLAQLQPEDEVAVVVFGETIRPISQFYTDKDRFYQEQLANLEIQVGANRMYDALRDAVINMPINTNRRQVVLMITDSSPRTDQVPLQTPLETIINEAVDSDIQIFALAYYSRDTPDVAGLELVTSATNGYAWINVDNTSIENIERGIIEGLNNAIRGLNSELRIDVGVSGLETDINNRLTLNLTVDLLNDPTLSDTVSCLVEREVNIINFVDTSDTVRIQGGTVDVGVSIQSDIPATDRRVVFFLDDAIVQNSEEEIYTFDATFTAPGAHSLRAELRNLEQEVLSTTATISLIAQQLIRLESRENADGSIDFVATVNSLFELPSVIFFVTNPSREVTDAGQPAEVELASRPFLNGQAILSLPEPSRTFNDLPFEVISGQLLEITASVPSTGDEPPLAQSNILQFVVPVLPEPSIPEPILVVPEPEPELNRELVLFISSLVFLSVLNILLLRQVARERIKRIIRNPDNHDLDDHLMTVTVQKDGVRQAYRLTKKTITIGRGSMNDINLGGDADISRHHGVIMWRRRGWYYSNRKRQAGARIDGRWYRGFVFRRLEPITNLEVGGTHMVFHSSAQQDISEFISTNI